MLTLARNADNDIFMTARGLAIAKDAACRCVIVDSIVSTQKGELQLDENRGIDYFGTVFESPKYISIWAAQVKKAINDLSWVTGIQEFDYEFKRDTQTVTWTAVINTAYGDTVTVGNSGRAFTSEKGDGRMGVRWSDIIGKPDGIDQIADRVARMKALVSEIDDLLPANTLKQTKDAINDLKRILANM